MIVALMVTNCVYSVANTIPMNQLHDANPDCGELALPFWGVRAGRSL